MIGLRFVHCETVEKIPDNTNIKGLNSSFLPPSYVHTRSTVVVVLLVRFDNL